MPRPEPGGIAQSVIRPLLVLSDSIAAIMLAADLLVVIVSVSLRFLFNAPVEWSDDIARGLMVGSSFFGAAGALARNENAVSPSLLRDCLWRPWRGLTRSPTSWSSSSVRASHSMPSNSAPSPPAGRRARACRSN